MSQIDLCEQVTDPPNSQPPQSVREVIERYINGRRDEKLESAKDDAERQKLIDKYQFDHWIEDASNRVSQIRLASHTAKQHHPASKASSVYVGQSVPHAGHHDFIGSADVELDPDVVGNAAALDIFKMLRLEYAGESLLRRLLRQDPEFQQALSSTPAKAQVLVERFQQFAQVPSKLVAGRTSKQVYFPVGDQYHLLTVLYSSSLVHRTWQKISSDRFGEQAKSLREARKNKEPSDFESREYKNVLLHRYGGTKPQNISQLNSDRRGSMWLLPSLPPTWSSKSLYLPKTQFFSKSLRYQSAVKLALNDLIGCYKKEYQPNNLAFRQKRDRFLSIVVDAILDLVITIQAQAALGWTEDSSLSTAERIWLDPHYVEALSKIEEPTLDQQQLLELVRTDEWHQQIAQAFGGWLNIQLSKEIADLDESEKRVWAVHYFADSLKVMWGNLV